jgi:diguanylate cyclase (GGDEF)-like protein/PAS domain S-box-containing protein
MSTEEKSNFPYRLLFESAHDGILILDAQNGGIVDANPYFIQLTGFTLKALQKKKFWELFSNKNISTARSFFLDLRANGHTRCDDLPVVNKRGELVHVDLICNTIKAEGQDIAQCSFRDMTERKQLMEDLIKSRDMLIKESILDAPSGQYNRMFMEDTLEREILRCYRKMSPLGVILMDFENFRKNNTNLSPDDVVLRRVGSMLRERFRGADVVARLGEDEFIAIMPEASREVTLKRIESLRLEISRLKFKFGRQVVSHPEISFGIAFFPDDGCNVANLVKAADQDLYRAKQKAKGYPVHQDFQF